MQPSIASRLADVLADGGWRAKARPEQLPPAGAWNGWLFLAGRGAGKTRSGAEWICESVETGEAKRIALVAPTAHDARHVMVEGESGILSIAPAWNRPDYEPSRRKLTWKSGAEAFTFSSEEADRLRGPQFDLAWADELAAWTDPQTAWDMLMLGLRLGRHPRWLATTTPRPIKLLKDLLTRKDVVISRATTFDNAANLASTFLEAVKARYEGTRLGRQELNAELLSDTPGALWQLDWLDKGRVVRAPELKRIVVAIDPAVSNSEGSDETGIVVAGIDHNDHGYVLADLSGRYGPRDWAIKAVCAYRDHKADRIVAEVNNGGAMVETTLRMVDASVPYRAVHASRGKVTRAEPISALYEQGKIHHVGTFSALEDQMCSFTSDFDRNRAGYSPDRLDALVWCLTELMTTHRAETKTAAITGLI
ncbi:MAG: terminase family protein [Xanthobacteraceae bacterium]